MKKKNILIIAIFNLICLSQTGCEKFLEAKPDQKLVVPSTVQDLQGLLDSYLRVNQYEPSAPETSADDYYLSDADWAGLTKDTYRRLYLWDKANLFEAGVGEWSYCYDNVFRANTVLDNLEKISVLPKEEAAFNNIHGQALALRARAFMKVASVWTLAYNDATADTDLGIPLRLNSDFNTPSVRSSLRETYSQIISDLKNAITLLPVTQIHVLRTSKPAAYALLARTYLSMGNYVEAGKYADSCLQLYNKLIDYNSLSLGATYPFKQFNDEVILSTRMLTPSSLGNTKAKIDSLLYKSYDVNDLRKTAFFRSNNNGTYGFKGSYEGSASLFDGIATNEVYLIRSECYARQGKLTEAMADLNTLLIKRWDKSKLFTPYITGNKADALKLVLAERRKELLMRGLRWTDIKRINKENASITLSRKINDNIYTLPARDLRFALPIPEDIIALTGMLNNPR